jgi:hypothetical protein
MSRLAVLVVLAVASSFTAQQAHGRDLSAPMKLFSRNGTVAVADSPKEDCVIKFEVKTASYWRAGTDSSIYFELVEEDGNSYPFVANYDYLFERGHLDVITFDDYPCDFRPCTLKLESDGEGSASDWFCEYVKVTVVSAEGVSEYQMQFKVNHWIGPNTGRMSFEVYNCGNHAHASMAAAS